MAKQMPCCSRMTSRLQAAKNELRRMARLEAYHAQKGHNISRFPEMLRSQKAEIARLEEQIIEHEGEHAGEPVSA
jgi:hypothetical protein